MQCTRCTGEMVYEVFQDLDDDTGNLFFYGWRCIVCGEILDPLIMSNRKHRPAPFLSKNKKYTASSRN